MMRLTPPRVVYIIGLLSLLYLLLKVFAVERETKRCDLSHEYQETLEETIGKVHRVLKKLSLTHVLCYDTLGKVPHYISFILHLFSVGQVRLGRNLPWEGKINFFNSIYNGDHLARVWIFLCLQ